MSKRFFHKNLLVWFVVLFLSLIFFTGKDNWKQSKEPIHYSDSNVLKSVSPANDDQFYEREISRIEFLRLLNMDFFRASFVENDPIPERRDLWLACKSLGWVSDEKLLKGELFVSGDEANVIFKSIWGGEVTPENGVLTDKKYDSFVRRIKVNRNSYFISRARSLEVLAYNLFDFNERDLLLEDFSVKNLPYTDIKEDYYIPFLREVGSRNILFDDWIDSTLEPSNFVTKAEALKLVFRFLNIDYKDKDLASLAFEHGLILKTEIGAYRFLKPIKYGEFKKLVLEAKRLASM